MDLLKKHLAIAAAVIAVSLGIALLLSTPGDPHATQSTAMSSAQADLLAVARFNDYQNRVSAIKASVPISGQTFELDGRVDWQNRLGYATLTARQQGGGTELLQWTPNGIAVRGGWGWSGPLPATPPADGWEVRAWQPGADLDTALQLILALGADKPENAQQIQRSGAGVLRHDSIGGEPVTVFAGPPESGGGSAGVGAGTGGTTSPAGAGSHTRYWITADGSLRRFEALVDGSTAWTEVDIAPGRAPAVPHIPGIS
jgi:hypothetical protein